MKYETLVSDILKFIGGKENVDSVSHCVTRLRFKVKNENEVNLHELEGLTGVLKVVVSGGQHQVIIGNHVPDVFRDLNLVMTGNSLPEMENIQIETEPQEKKGESKVNKVEKKKILDKFIDIVSGVFTPALGVLAATGMIKGFLALAVALKLITAGSGTYEIINVLGDSFFYFFPIFLGYTASKKFDGNIFIGMTIGASLIHPNLQKIMANQPMYALFKGTFIESPINTTFAGIPLMLMNYSSTVVPIILAVYFSAKLERIINKIIPDVVKTFLVPFFTLLIIVPLTFIVIGPIATWASKLVGLATLSINNFSPVLLGIFIGGFWQVFVMFGLHWGIIPLAINNFMTFGYDPVLAGQFGASFAQIGVVLAIIIKTRDLKLKGMSISAFISGLFGVTEPAIYGITLPRKKPFVISCIAAAISGGLLSWFGAKVYMIGGLGIFGITSFIKPNSSLDMSFYGVIISIVVAFVLGFVMTYFLGFENTKKEKK